MPQRACSATISSHPLRPARILAGICDRGTAASPHACAVAARGLAGDVHFVAIDTPQIKALGVVAEGGGGDGLICRPRSAAGGPSPHPLGGPFAARTRRVGAVLCGPLALAAPSQRPFDLRWAGTLFGQAGAPDEGGRLGRYSGPRAPAASRGALPYACDGRSALGGRLGRPAARTEG